MTKPFAVGDRVSWKMLDGNIMTGEVTFIGWNTLEVKRPDGGMATVKTSYVKFATQEEWDASIDFFRNLGK